jgi:hypothetical protein
VSGPSTYVNPDAYKIAAIVAVCPMRPDTPERLSKLPKLEVVGSNPMSRSEKIGVSQSASPGDDERWYSCWY